MKKENIIGVVIAVASIFLLLLILFIWLLTRSKKSTNTTYGPTPTLLTQPKNKQGENETSTHLSSSVSSKNSSKINTGGQNESNSSVQQDPSSRPSSSFTILGNQYTEKNYNAYFSSQLQKQDEEIRNSLQETIVDQTTDDSTNSSTSNSVTSPEVKKLSSLLKLFSTFLSVPQMDDISDIDLSKYPTVPPTPPFVIQPLPASPGLLRGKIGIYILSDYSQGAKQIVASKPRILKVMDPQSNNTLAAIIDYKSANPQGIAVLRAYIGTSGVKFSLADDPDKAAQSFFQTVVQPVLSALGENVKLFDFIETPNELDNTPGWESSANTTWLNTFWSKLTDLYSTAGLRTCIASIPVGNPPGDYNQLKGELTPFLPALQKVKSLGGAFCYHAYTLNYSTDVNQEVATSLRYRQIHQAIAELDGSLSSLPFILSEAGVDQNGNPKTSGWNARGSEGDYKNWLSWFNGQINQDSYVLGATLYQIGDNHWSSFNIESIADWISKSL